MNAFLLALALYHAPVVFQQTGHNAKADQISRMDFDGDLIANNNWDNLEKFATPAFGYYDVRETHTHYFIFYAYFHARDYSRVCIPKICHENDLEGAVLVVRKDETEFGKLIAIQTLAHNRIFTYMNPPHIAMNPETDVAQRTKRPTLFVEWGGHGIYAYDPESKGKIKMDSLLQVAKDNPSEMGIQGAEKTRYLVYIADHLAEDPGENREGIYRYALLSIHEEMWQRRHDVGEGRLYWSNYNYLGQRFKLQTVPVAFAGEAWSKARANPPWAWVDSSRDDVNKGDWFFDPAYFFERTLRQMPGPVLDLDFSTEYLHHPYLGT